MKKASSVGDNALKMIYQAQSDLIHSLNRGVGEGVFPFHALWVCKSCLDSELTGSWLGMLQSCRGKTHMSCHQTQNSLWYGQRGCLLLPCPSDHRHKLHAHMHTHTHSRRCTHTCFPSLRIPKSGTSEPGESSGLDVDPLAILLATPRR